MSFRGTLRACLRVAVAGSIVVVVSVLPVSIGLDPDEPLTAPPVASTVLLGGSSTLLAIAGFALRRRQATERLGAKPVA